MKLNQFARMGSPDGLPILIQEGKNHHHEVKRFWSLLLLGMEIFSNFITFGESVGVETFLVVRQQN